MNYKKKSGSKKILLTGVFGPFGVDDEWGRKENIMELFHNQVTKAQGAASLRFHHRSFGLYFIASNLKADVNVLDFPSLKRFIREIKKSYDAVGISFIAPNYKKAKEMARLIRLYSPQTEIILGGHGAAIEGVEELIDCDHVVKGEGIAWMRDYIGQNRCDPIEHPHLPSTERRSIFGIPLPGVTAGILVPGVGCVNACSFCSTSHFFGKKYTSYIDSGEQLYNTCCSIADDMNTDSFFVMDENFLKNEPRAHSLIKAMEKNDRFFSFSIFSSAETILSFGYDNLVKLGVQFVWIGFESKTAKGEFEKNAGIDPEEIVRELRRRGISVLASGILCMEHHTPENIMEDIDFMISLNADAVQFMLFTPLPVTALYEKMKKAGILKPGLSWEEWHGQKDLNWFHQAFPGDLASKTITEAFRKEYESNSSTILRMIDTALQGYETLREQVKTDKNRNIEQRYREMKERVESSAILLKTIKANAVNNKEFRLAEMLEVKIEKLLGKPTLSNRFLSRVAVLLGYAWKIRVLFKGDMIQPRTIFTEYSKQDIPLQSSEQNNTSILPSVQCLEMPGPLDNAACRPN